MKHEDNFCAQVWYLKDPAGNNRVFKNLANFIRENPDLFCKEHIVWKKSLRIGCHGNTGESCLAYYGLCQLKPYKKDGTRKSKVNASWFEWSWCGGN